MSSRNNSDEDIDTYWQDIKMDDTYLKNGSFSSTIRTSVNEQLTSEKQDKSNSLSDIDNLLSELSSKYCLKEPPSTETSKYQPNLKETSKIPNNSSSTEESIGIVEISDSEESDNEHVSKSKSSCKVPAEKCLTFVCLSDSEEEIRIDKSTKPTAKSTIQKMTKEEQAVAKKTLQEEKRVLKQIKKADDLKAKQIKNQACKNLKPDEYLKQIEVIIDDGLSEKPLAKDIIKVLEENEIKYLKKPQIVSNIITWQRKLENIIIDRDQLISTCSTNDCDVVLFILECADLLDLIEKDELIAHFKSAQEIMPGKMITVGLYGVNDYLRFAKNQKNRRVKNDVSDTHANAMFDKHIIEEHLIKLQVLIGISNRYLDTSRDIAAFVNHMTKAVAQIPYKLKRRDRIQLMDNYMIGDNKDCVVVDKNGNGLSRLWQQSIASFPLARLDLAESIMSSYPTFQSLMRAYESCDETQGGKLLENLEIRRAAGLLTNFRKVGPEFSKRMFRYYNSRDPNVLL